MRNTASLSIIISLFISCGSDSQKSQRSLEEEHIVAEYDTIAIDSFSQGAVSVNVAEQIRRSSLSYQDSIKKVRATEKAIHEARALEQIQQEQAKKESLSKETSSPVRGEE